MQHPFFLIVPHSLNCSIYIIGVAILFVTSLPVSLSHGAGLPGLIVAMVTISVGLGGIKATLPPFLGRLQYLSIR